MTCPLTFISAGASAPCQGSYIVLQPDFPCLPKGKVSAQVSIASSGLPIVLARNSNTALSYWLGAALLVVLWPAPGTMSRNFCVLGKAEIILQAYSVGESQSRWPEMNKTG